MSSTCVAEVPTPGISRLGSSAVRTHNFAAHDSRLTLLIRADPRPRRTPMGKPEGRRAACRLHLRHRRHRVCVSLPYSAPGTKPHTRTVQVGACRLARAFTYRRGRRRVLRRCPPGAYIPHRHEPRRTRAPALAAHRIDRLDRGLWAGRFGRLAVHDGCDCVEDGYQEPAAAVSILSLCTYVEYRVGRGRLMRVLLFCRLVSMMGFMVFLLALVPSTPRRIE